VSELGIENRLKGRHVLYIVCGFFGVIFAVNSVFLYVALHTRPGEDAGASYEKGLHYNNTLAEERSQDALGWHHRLKLASSSALRLEILDAKGTPVSRLSVLGRLGRPASDRSDRVLGFAETGPGVYEAKTDALESGGWIASITAQKTETGGRAEIYRVKERLWLGSPAH
jgi:nitrogen fixation protein FixH